METEYGIRNTESNISEKTPRKNLTTTPFSEINNASVDLNKVCLHVTYLFLKELLIASDVFLLTSVQRK